MTFYEKHKQLVDQSAHAGVGAFFTWFLSFGLPLWSAFVVMMWIAFVRELYQHEWSVFKMGWWSWADLWFFAVGGAAAAWLIA